MLAPRDPRESHLPGGYGRGTFYVGQRSPRLVRGYGFRVVDEAGRALIDLNNNFTVLVHGHAHPQVTEAAVDAAWAGACFGMPTAAELDHAEELVGRVPWAEQVRYASSGTEAVMLAVRLARASTARNRIVVLSPAYHGTADAVLPAPGAVRGVPEGTLADVVTVAPGDVDAVHAAFDAFGDDIAAVLLDLAPALDGCVPLEETFVRAVDDLARAHGAFVVVDEIISFRHAVAGYAHDGYGLAPDLLVVGKVIGGGFPIGAVLGTEESMRLLDPSLPDGLQHGGTFTANPVSLRAGKAALRLYDHGAVERLNALGRVARHRLGEVARPFGWDVRGVGSVFRLAPAENDSAERRRALWWAAYDHGVLLSTSGVLCLSTPMDEPVLDDIADRLHASFETMEDRREHARRSLRSRRGMLTIRTARPARCTDCAREAAGTNDTLR
ncbi:MAG: aminotransferase class III-fold pyridoxal phosphate-dependent enzyme [Solirubrobacterales bacterium]